MFRDSRTSTTLHFLLSWTNTSKTNNWNYGTEKILHFTYKNYVQLTIDDLIRIGDVHNTGEGANTNLLVEDELYEDIRRFNNKWYGLRTKYVELSDYDMRRMNADSDGDGQPDGKDCLIADHTYLKVKYVEEENKWYGLKSVHVYETTDSGSQYPYGNTTSSTKAVYTNQTASDMTGYELENYEPDSTGKATLNSSNTDVDWEDDSRTNRHATINFFYRRKYYSLKFRNLNIKEDSKTRNVYFDQSLSTTGIRGNKIFFIPEYPFPDLADYYTFDGWYEDPQHTKKVDSVYDEEGKIIGFADTARMPADDDTLYAKWVPITKHIKFYNDYRHYATDYNMLHECDVDYDTRMLTKDIPTTEDSCEFKLVPPTVRSIFSGWYYINENDVPVRFDPEVLPVTHDLELYAEWVSKDTARYYVTFVEKGTNIEVAPPVRGTAFVSKTKSFKAKSGNELNQAHAWGANQSNWWPTVSSHSILIVPNYTGEEYLPNVHTFEYIKKDQVWYRVRYLDAVTGHSLFEDEIKQSHQSVVTEVFKYKEGFISDRVTNSAVLSASDNPNEDEAKAEELSNNVIIFYYNKNESKALYQIDHKVEKTDCTDDTDLDQYELYHSETLTTEINSTLNVSQIQNNSSVSATLVQNGYSIDSTCTEVNGVTAIADQTVTVNGDRLIITLYYKRLRYNYKVKYVDYEQEKAYDIEMAKPEEDRNPDFWNGELNSTTYSGDNAKKVGETVAINPPAGYDYTPSGAQSPTAAHYTRISDRQLSLTIRADIEDPQTNVIKVYYRKDSQRILKYQVSCVNQVNSDEVYAHLSKSRETAENQEGVKGCTVYKDGIGTLTTKYTFLGWYGNPYGSGTCLGTETTYIPQFPGADMTYYAVFRQDMVKAKVSLMYNNSGDFFDTEDPPVLDEDGSITGSEIFFEDPHNYTNNSETPYDSNKNFEFELRAKDNKVYKYVFEGWYEKLVHAQANDTGGEELEDKFIKHNDYQSKTIKEVSDNNYEFVAMFKKVDTIPYRIIYRFKPRNKAYADSDGYCKFVKTGLLENASVDGDTTDDGYVKLLSEKIAENAPYESNHGETLI